MSNAEATLSILDAARKHRVEAEVSEAEALAESVMAAAGSSLKHYMPHSKARIIAACQAGIDRARLALLTGKERDAS